MAVNTKNVTNEYDAEVESGKTIQQKVNDRRDFTPRMNKLYKAEKKVKVKGSPMYRDYFGDSMPIVLNGNYISVPLNGMTYEIPESFAQVFEERIHRIDMLHMKTERMESVSMDTFIGDVPIFEGTDVKTAEDF